MTEREACRILGIPEGAEQSVVKKKYRQLILRVHPDIGQGTGTAYLDEAQRMIGCII
ncbi:MAG: DnaJ domain-containing protein [Blautia sp.]|nr:DnaJ domain-containing protein [Blautia sp.]